MSEDLSFDDLIARLRAGDDDAATQVFNRYTQRLIALARSQLDSQIRQKEDPEDVVQSVFRSFFTRQADGQFDLKNEDSLWTLLALITVRKCRNRMEFFHAACRDVQREVSIPSGSDAPRPDLDGIAHDPTPSEAAMLSETLEQLMRGLDKDDRQMVALHLQGYSIPEISSQIGWSERTVRRVIERARKRMLRMRPR